MHPDLICLVLSLERATDRRNAISTSLNQLGIPFEFISGIDARVTDVSQVVDIDGSRPCSIAQRRLTKGELACAYGHVLTYRRFLASGAKYALILEDDVILNEDLVTFLRGQHYHGARLLLLNHIQADAYRFGARNLFGRYRSFATANSPFMACSYIVDRTTAAKLIAANTPVNELADWPIAAQTLGVRVVEPQMVLHPVDESNPSIIGYRPYVSIQPRKRRPSDYLTRWYWRRKWLKLTTSRIS